MSGISRTSAASADEVRAHLAGVDGGRRGRVSPGHVRDFRGAMAGRGDKGLLITTGTFSKDARSEATRDGAPPIELIDGEMLCDLLKQYELGVRTIPRLEEGVTVITEFFDDI